MLLQQVTGPAGSSTFRLAHRPLCLSCHHPASDAGSCVSEGGSVPAAPSPPNRTDGLPDLLSGPALLNLPFRSSRCLAGGGGQWGVQGGGGDRGAGTFQMEKPGEQGLEGAACWCDPTLYRRENRGPAWEGSAAEPGGSKNQVLISRSQTSEATSLRKHPSLRLSQRKMGKDISLWGAFQGNQPFLQLKPRPLNWAWGLQGEPILKKM